VLSATVLLIYGSYWMHLRLCESHSGNNEQSWRIQLVFTEQKWSDECQGCWMLRTNIYQQNIHRCGMNYRSHPRKQRHHHLQCGWWVGNLISNMPKYSETRCKHKTDCHKICALCAEQWGKGESCSCVPGPSG